MKEINLDELKVLQLEILKKIHQYCEEKSLRYSLDSGTLIGAVRHKGYIPWDDDIDIIMPRPDYMRFIRGFNNTYENLYVLAPELNWNYYASYANVCDSRTILLEDRISHRGMEIGVKVDIFPVDGVSENEQEYLKDLSSIRTLRSVIGLKKRRLSDCRGLNFKQMLYIWKMRARYCFHSYSQIQKKINRIATTHPFENSSYAANIAFSVTRNRCPIETFLKYEDVSFEGYEFKIICNYDEYLSRMYGDYMTLPPVEKRIPHHGFKAFWKN